jgi:predicted permease
MDKVSTLVLMVSLIIIMLGMGLSLVLDDFKRIFIYPKAILLGLVNQLILLPLIGFAIVVAFPLTPQIAIGIMTWQPVRVDPLPISLPTWPRASRRQTSALSASTELLSPRSTRA